eukprot:1170505-Rhodomonas_salina.1
MYPAGVEVHARQRLSDHAELFLVQARSHVSPEYTHTAASAPRTITQPHQNRCPTRESIQDATGNGRLTRFI